MKKENTQLYNLLIKHRDGTYNILGITLDQLNKFVRAYLNGEPHVTLAGKKHFLISPQEIKIFKYTSDASLDKAVNFFINNVNYRKSNNHYGYYLPASTLSEIGKDVTYDFLKDEAFGSKSKPPKHPKSNEDQITIFLSWQLDNRDEKKLIQKSLEKVINQLKKEGYKIKLEQDMRETSGSSDIPDTLFKKISKSDIFIADVNLVYESSFREDYFAPNPNVMIELGYAAAELGWSHIILIMNNDDFKIEQLPFDIRHRSVCHYSSKNLTYFEGKLKEFVLAIIKV